MASDMLNAGYFLARWFSRADVKGKIKITVTFESDHDYYGAMRSTMMDQYDRSMLTPPELGQASGFPSELCGLAFEFKSAERRPAPPPPRRGSALCDCGYCASCTRL
jgi:hypothetical protein